MKLSENQLAHLRRVGLAVDELEFRSEALRRVTDSTREALRIQRTRAAELSETIEERHLVHAVASGDDVSIAQSKKLSADRALSIRQVARLEQQMEEAEAQHTALIGYFAPLRSVFERLMARCELSMEDLGIPHGQVVPRTLRADVVVGARS